MRYTERDRRELIKQLKKVRDPRERDRIIWALAGHEEATPHRSAPAVQRSRPAPGKTLPEKPVPVKPPDIRNLPQIAIDAKRMLRFVVPGFFMVLGLAYIGQAILNYIAFRRIETEMSRLITGGIFLIIGLMGILKAMQSGRIKQDGKS
jgi:hypothetical protein